MPLRASESPSAGLLAILQGWAFLTFITWRALGRYFNGKDDVFDKRFNIKPDDPANAAWQIAKRCSPEYVEELILFLSEYLDQARRNSQERTT